MDYSRQEPRCAVEWNVILSGYGFEAKGIVKEISGGDLRLVSTDRLRPGTSMFLCINLPDGQKPLDIECATVQWAHACEAGLKFVIMGLESRERLAACLRENLECALQETLRRVVM